MKKLRILVVLAISTLLLIPFGSFTRAQPSTYVGVQEGDVYTWKINFDVDGLDQLINNTRQLLVDRVNNMPPPDLFGFESLTISESIDQVIDTALNMIFPTGWENMNLSSVIEEIIHPFIGDLNFSALIDYVVDGLNSIMPSGWENYNITELVYSIMNELNTSLIQGPLPQGWENYNITELVYSIMNELNTSHVQGRLPQGWENLPLIELGLYTINELDILGILPPGWENFSITEFVYFAIDTLDIIDILPPGWENEELSDLLHEILLSVIPEGFSFNFLLENALDFLLPLLIPGGITQYSIDGLFALLPPEILNLNISTGIEELFSLFLPGSFHQYSIDYLFALLPESILQYSINELFALLPAEILNLNFSAAIDLLTSYLNLLMPVGWESQSLNSLIEYFVDMLIGMLDPGLASMDMSTIIESLIDNFVEPNLYYILSSYIGPLPLGWESLTISELLQLYSNNMILMWDLTVAAQWNSLRSSIEMAGFVYNEIKIKARVENIKNEISLYLGGPRGVPINLTLLISLDTVNWIPISTLLNSFGIDLSFFTGLPMLVDPSTYSNNLIAFIDQLPFTGGLIIGTNYSVEPLSQDIVLPITGDPNGIVISAEWTNKGVLKSVTIEASGITAFSIELEIEEPEEIPGYEVPIILGTSFFVIIGVILIVKKKNKIRS